MKINPSFYRVSVKALVRDSSQKFLLCLEENGMWELPGGGLDFGEEPQNGLIREIREEMNLEIEFLDENPFCFFTFFEADIWRANVVYEVGLKNLNFTPSDECVELKYFSPDEIIGSKFYPNVIKFASIYKNELQRKNS